MNPRAPFVLLTAMIALLATAPVIPAFADDQGDVIAPPEMLRTPLMAGDDFPDFTTTDVHGNKIDTATIEGPFAISFWATWCGPCRAEMPELEAVAKSHGDDVTIIGVSVDEPEDADAIIEFMAENHIDFTVVHDLDSTIEEPFEVTGIPTLVYVGADHTILEISVGFGGPEESKFWQDWGVHPTSDAADTVIPGDMDDQPAPAETISTAPAIGDRFPNLTLTDLDGATITTDDLTTPFAISFWATWCGPCRMEMPELQKLHAQYGDAITVIGVSVDQPEDAPAVADLTKEMGITFPIAQDMDGSLSSQFDIQFIPLMYYVGADHIVKFVHDGYDDEMAEGVWVDFPIEGD